MTPDRARLVRGRIVGDQNRIRRYRRELRFYIETAVRPGASDEVAETMERCAAIVWLSFVRAVRQIEDNRRDLAGLP